MCDRTFCCSLKMCECAIAHFFALRKSAKKVWSDNCSFEMSKCVKMCKKVRIRTFLHFLRTFLHICPFRKSNWQSFYSTILKFTLFCTFSHIRTFLFFENVRLCDCTFFCSWKMCKKYEKSECAKMCEFPNRTFFAQKKSDRTFSKLKLTKNRWSRPRTTALINVQHVRWPVH